MRVSAPHADVSKFTIFTMFFKFLCTVLCTVLQRFFVRTMMDEC